MGRAIRDLANGVNLTDKHLQAIGEVAVRWAELEEGIEEIIWDLANIRHMSALSVTAHIGATQLIDMAKSLVELLVTGPEKQLADAINDHLNHIKEKIYPQRNAMVHSTFGHSGKDGITQILPITARGKLKIGPRRDYSADDILSIAHQIYDANEKLYVFASRLRELIPTWRHIQNS